MSKNIFLYSALALTVLFVAGFGYTQYLKPQLDDRTVTTVAQMPITSPVAPISFVFPSGASALAMIEPPTGDVAETGIKEVYLLMDNAAYTAFSQDEQGTPPPSISVFVLPYVQAASVVGGMKRMDRLQAWAVENPGFSSWGAAVTGVTETDIDGASAITYQTESVYKQDVYLTLYEDDIYVFTGQYESEDDVMRTMFNDILASVILN